MAIHRASYLRKTDASVSQQPLAANCPSVGVQRVLWAPPQIHVLILTVLIFLGFMHAAADAVSSYVQWACPVRKTVPQQPLQLPAPQSTRDFYDLLFAFFLLSFLRMICRGTAGKKGFPEWSSLARTTSLCVVCQQANEIMLFQCSLHVCDFQDQASFFQRET